MNDMRAVIIPKSDQINADALLAGPLTITITSVKITPGTEQPVSISFDGDNERPYKPCKSMARVMVHCWGPDANQYIGRSMTLYCDPKVLWGGMAVGGIRISHMTNIAGTQVMALTMTKGNKKPFTVNPLVIKPEAPAIDKIEMGVRSLIDRIQAADHAGLRAITMDPAVVKQRAWLAKNKADLAAKVDDVISLALANYDSNNDTQPIPVNDPAADERATRFNPPPASVTWPKNDEHSPDNKPDRFGKPGTLAQDLDDEISF